MRVPAAGIWQHEDVRAVDLQGLRSRTLDPCGTGPIVWILEDKWQDGAPERHTHQRDDSRTKALDLPFEDFPSLDVFRRLEHVDPWRRTRDQVRDAHSQLWQPHVVFMREGFRRQARVPKQFPEAI